MRVHSSNSSKIRRFYLLSLTLLLLGIPVLDVHGWGGPHTVITRAACDTLPQWQKDLWGDELTALGDSYCLIPDRVYEGMEIARFAMIDSKPGVIYLISLHLPPETVEGYQLLEFFSRKAVSSFKDGQKGDAARYAGTVSHMLEDWGCPAHAVPGDNMFTLFKQFMPPPEDQENTLLHGPVENGNFTLDLQDYKPRLLGTTVEEAAFNLLNRSHLTTVYARGQVIPIINGLYEKDDDAVNNAQQKAALLDAEIVADALYTIICIAEQNFEPQEVAALQRMDISGNYPLEAPNLYMPQSSFFSKPYWGFATAGKILKNGNEAVPLKLRVKSDEGTVVQTMTSGIGTGTRSVLTYVLPADVYRNFSVTVGVHPELGAEGSVNFEIKGNGILIGKAGPLSGTDTAQTLNINLNAITNLQLTASSAAGGGAGNYAIWGEPQLGISAADFLDVDVADFRLDIAGETNNPHADTSGIGTWGYWRSDTVNPSDAGANLVAYNWNVGAGEFRDPAGLYGQVRQTNLHPGEGNYTVVRWQAGSNNTYVVNGFFQRQVSGADGDGVSVFVYVNGQSQQISTNSLPPITGYPKASFNFISALNEGQFIDFVVHANTTLSYDRTDFDVSIVNFNPEMTNQESIVVLQ